MTDTMEKEKGQMHLNLIGYCDNPSCGNITSRIVDAHIDESCFEPCQCGKCHQGTVHFESLEVHHVKHGGKGTSVRDKSLFWILRIILILAILYAGFSLYAAIRISRNYSVDEVGVALKSTSGRSTPEILRDFLEAGINERTLARILTVSPFTLRRIMAGESVATVSLDANIRGLYADYLLLDSKILFLKKYSRRSTDQWYAFKNPLQEVDAATSEPAVTSKGIHEE